LIEYARVGAAATTFLLRFSLAKHHEEDDEPGVQVEAKAGEEVGDEPGVQMEANAGGEIAEEGTAAVNMDSVVEAPSGYDALELLEARDIRLEDVGRDGGAGDLPRPERDRELTGGIQSYHGA